MTLNQRRGGFRSDRAAFQSWFCQLLARDFQNVLSLSKPLPVLEIYWYLFPGSIRGIVKY